MFEAKVDEGIKYPEYLKEYDSELKSYGFEAIGDYYTGYAGSPKKADQLVKELRAKGYLVWRAPMPSGGDYEIRILGRKNNVKKFYKDIDGKLYKMF